MTEMNFVLNKILVFEKKFVHLKITYAIIIDGTKFIWGISAAGSAFDWQSRGQGFDPPMLHQKKKADDESVFFF